MFIYDFRRISEARWHRGNEPVLDKVEYFVMDGFFVSYQQHISGTKNSRYAAGSRMNLQMPVLGSWEFIQEKWEPAAYQRN